MQRAWESGTVSCSVWLRMKRSTTHSYLPLSHVFYAHYEWQQAQRNLRYPMKMSTRFFSIGQSPFKQVCSFQADFYSPSIYADRERGGSVVECRTPEREVGGSKPTAAVLCPWARHFTPRKYWLITQEAVAQSRHDWKIVDWDVKPQHKQTNNLRRGVYNFCLSVNMFVSASITFLEFPTKFSIKLRESFSCGVYLTNYWSKGIPCHEFWPQGSCPGIDGAGDQNLLHL